MRYTSLNLHRSFTVWALIFAQPLTRLAPETPFSEPTIPLETVPSGASPLFEGAADEPLEPTESSSEA